MQIIIAVTCTPSFGWEVPPDSFVHACCAEEVWIPRNSVEFLEERVEDRPCELRDDAGGVIAIQTSVSRIIELVAVSSDSSWTMAPRIAKRSSVIASLEEGVH